MPTVYLPLASAEAYGAMGEMFVFQGVSCRKYVVPRDPRTVAQMSVRETFYDVTKMMTFCGLWAKAAWRTAFGSRWYTSLYKRITENTLQRWTIAAAVWEGFTNDQKDQWDMAAPFQVSYNSPGMVFYILMDVMGAWLVELGAPNFEFAGVDENGAGDAAVWAVKDLSDVLTAGMHNDSHAIFQYAGTWSTPTDALAYGGQYHESAATGSPSMSFYFYGSQFGLVFQKSSGRGIAKVASFGMTDQLLDQNQVSTEYGAVVLSPGLSKSLHYVTITRTGAGAINVDGLEVATTARKPVVAQAVSEYFTIPGASVYRTTQQTINTTWTLVGWEAAAWDTQAMFDSVLQPGRLVCNMQGFYDVGAAVKAYVYVANTVNFEIRVNGARVADDLYITPVSGGPYTQILRAGRKVELMVGDYVELWMKRSQAGAPVTLWVDLPVYPIFEVQMLSRQTLKVGTVNVVVN